MTVARRDNGAKQQVRLPRVAGALDEMLETFRRSLFAAAREEPERRTLRDPSGHDEMIE